MPSTSTTITFASSRPRTSGSAPDCSRAAGCCRAPGRTSGRTEGEEATWDSSPFSTYSTGARSAAGLVHVRRIQPRGAQRHPGQPDRRAARPLHQRDVRDVLQGLLRRRFELAGDRRRCARRIETSSKDGRHRLAVWSMGEFRRGRNAALLRSPGHRHGHVRPFGPRIPGGPVSRRAAGVRRGRVPDDPDGERPAGHGRVPQRHHGQLAGSRRASVRVGGDRRRRGSPAAAEQAIAHQPVRGPWLRQGWLGRFLPRRPGSVSRACRPSGLPCRRT